MKIHILIIKDNSNVHVFLIVRDCSNKVAMYFNVQAVVKASMAQTVTENVIVDKTLSVMPLMGNVFVNQDILVCIRINLIT